MAEYISKDEIIEAHYNACKKDPSKCFEVWSLQIMLDMPTIDIVRCSECEWSGEAEYSPEFECEYYHCKYCNMLHLADFFCANGERNK